MDVLSYQGEPIATKRSLVSVAKHRIKWWLSDTKVRLRMSLYPVGMWFIRKAAGDCNSIRWAKEELARIPVEDGDDMQAIMNRDLLDMVTVFACHGHSGFSSAYARSVLDNLLGWKIIAPLTGADDEWAEAYDMDGTQQNKRASHVFRDKDGRAYDINGIVFREPSGATYTGKGSAVTVEFPYYPKTEYVDVNDEGERITPMTLPQMMREAADYAEFTLARRGVATLVEMRRYAITVSIQKQGFAPVLRDITYEDLANTPHNLIKEALEEMNLKKK